MLPKRKENVEWTRFMLTHFEGPQTLDKTISSKFIADQNLGNVTERQKFDGLCCK